MSSTFGRASTPRVTLEPEVDWSSIAPLLDELQSRPECLGLTVERRSFRPGAGGLALPVLILIVLNPVMVEVVKDIYPQIKSALYSVYKKLRQQTLSGIAYPLVITVESESRTISYRMPEGLSEDALQLAVTTISRHHDRRPFQPRGDRAHARILLRPGHARVAPIPRRGNQLPNGSTRRSWQLLTRDAT